MGERPIRAVILAAGSSTRTAPTQKLLAAFKGRRLIDYAIEAALPWSPVVVAGAQVARALRGRTDCTVLLNEHPERGMSYSLKVANAALAPEASLLVLLADKPLLSQSITDRICAERAAVTFPVHAVRGTPGHPVLFDASTRWRIWALRDGDTLHALRDDPTLVRSVIPMLDEGAFFDVDDVTALDEAAVR